MGPAGNIVPGQAKIEQPVRCRKGREESRRRKAETGTDGKTAFGGDGCSHSAFFQEVLDRFGTGNNIPHMA
jgi:hypothetical protein